MKKLFVLPLAALAVAAACSDNPAGVPMTSPETPLFDNIVSDIAVVAGTRTMSLVVAGTGTTTLSVDPTNGDGKNGCNMTGGTTLVVSVASSAASVATVSPTSLTFASCGDTKTLTVTGVAAGSAEITLSQVSNNTGATFDFNPAKFTVVVSQPAPTDNTPPSITPSISGTEGDNGWYTSNVSVGWTVMDGESTITSTSGCGTTIIDEDTDGITLTCTATSAGGTSSQSVTIKRDATAPTISGAPDRAANGNGWYNADVTVSFTCTDGTSGIASCTSASTLGEGAGQSVSGTAVDQAGNTASTTVSGINIDKTAPTASASASPAPNANGWNNSAVTVSFSGNDGSGSGIDFCDAAVLLGNEGANQSASGTCTDKAGNVSQSVTKSGINLDLTNPTVSLVGGPANGGTYYFGGVPAAPTCEASDALSGLDGSCQVSGYGTTVGTHTVTASVKDKAGNQSTASVTYTVLAWVLELFALMAADRATAAPAQSQRMLPIDRREGSGASTRSGPIPTGITFAATKVTCPNAATIDPVEETFLTTGSTSLRYDTTEGQFIQNWKTPSVSGTTCYQVTMTTQDGSNLVAFFSLRK